MSLPNRKLVKRGAALSAAAAAAGARPVRPGSPPARAGGAKVMNWVSRLGEAAATFESVPRPG